MTDTRLLDDLLFARPGLDRASHRRSDPAFVAQLLREGSRVMWVHQGEAPVVTTDGATALLLMTGDEARSILGEDPAALSFLGADAQGTSYVAVHLQDRSLLPGEQLWMGLRDAARGLSDVDASAFVGAIALDNWRARHRRCPICGDALEVTQAGWVLRCLRDGLDHFPRTDPAIIVLVRDAQDRALLARHANWPPGRMSTLAGFVEPGESAEAAVRREVFEETGVTLGTQAGDLTYLGSQPWPFPASLMMGYHALAADASIQVDEVEISEARWFSREELRAACASGELRLPPSYSISRMLVERWLGAGIPGEAEN